MYVCMHDIRSNQCKSVQRIMLDIASVIHIYMRTERKTNTIMKMSKKNSRYSFGLNQLNQRFWCWCLLCFNFVFYFRLPIVDLNDFGRLRHLGAFVQDIFSWTRTPVLNTSMLMGGWSWLNLISCFVG